MVAKQVGIHVTITDTALLIKSMTFVRMRMQTSMTTKTQSQSHHQITLSNALTCKHLMWIHHQLSKDLVISKRQVHQEFIWLRAIMWTLHYSKRCICNSLTKVKEEKGKQTFWLSSKTRAYLKSLFLEIQLLLRKNREWQVLLRAPIEIM